MTDEERANRNPAVEVTKISRDELQAMPELTVRDLELNRVYLLEGRRMVATFNYMGRALGAHAFYGPRAKLTVFLRERPDGSDTLEDGSGIKVTIRKYTGEDA